MDDRVYDRVRQLVPPETRRLRALVVGAGMVGSWTAAALARLVSHVTVVDYDTIEEANVGVQLYTPADVGERKIHALANYCIGLPVKTVDAVIPVGDWGIEEADTAETGHSVWMNYDFDVVVSAIDSMVGREWVAMRYYDTARDNRLFIDIRVMGEMVCVLTSHDNVSHIQYLQTILPDDAVEEVDCGSEGTVYSGMFAAQRVAAIVNNWGRRVPPPAKEVWNVPFLENLYALAQEQPHGSSEEEGGEEGHTQEGRQEGDAEGQGANQEGSTEGQDTQGN